MGKSKKKTRKPMKWFVKWNDRVRGWDVCLGQFTPSWFQSKHLAEKERDRLNRESGFDDTCST